jgi:hypothetical protein
MASTALRDPTPWEMQFLAEDTEISVFPMFEMPAIEFIGVRFLCKFDVLGIY